MISATAPRCSSRATIITGLLGSGKTWSLTDQLLEAARAQTIGTYDQTEEQREQGGALLALTPRDTLATLRYKVDVERPLGCTKYDIFAFHELVRTIVDDFSPTVGSYPRQDGVYDRKSMAVFLHKNIDALPLGRLRPTHAQDDIVKPLLNLFSGLAFCGIAPEDYLHYVTTLESALEERGGALEGGRPPPEQGVSNAHDGGRRAFGAAPAPLPILSRSKLEAEAWCMHVAVERAKADSYEAFVALKRQEQVMDYPDRVLLARQILTDSAVARASMSLPLSHIYIDDLHECPPAMMDIVMALVAPGVGITATFDPVLAASFASQFPAIDAFGAEQTAIAKFRRAFPEAVERHLEPGRGRDSAVTRAMGLIYPRDEPIGTKTKKASRMGAEPVESEPQATSSSFLSNTSAGTKTAPLPPLDDLPTEAELLDEGSRLTCLTFESESDEMAALGRRVRELLDKGVSPSDIGIAAIGGIGVTNTIISSLSAAGIPVYGRRSSNVFDNETPRMLMSFLRCLLHPSESTPLLHLIMSCPAYRMPGGELPAALEGHLSRYVPLRSFLQSSQLGEGEGTNWTDKVSSSARRMAGRLLSDVNRFAEASQKRGVRQVMLDFLRHTKQLGRLEEPTTVEEEREGEAVAELFKMVQLAEKEAGGDSVALVEPVLRLYRRYAGGLKDAASSERAEIVDMATGSSSMGAVHVFQPGRDSMEHPSFHTVFVPFCSKQRLPGNLRRAKIPVPAPFCGVSEALGKERFRSETDLARLSHENTARAALYTALGAARQDVRFSLSARSRSGKNHLVPSPFLVEILGAGAPVERKWDAPKEEQDAMHLSAEPITKRDGPDVHSSPLRLSFSSINSYRSCPHSYYLQHVLNVSPPPNPRMVYGRAMHEAVATLLRDVVARSNGSDAPPTTMRAAGEYFKLNFDGCAFESAAQVRMLTANGVAGMESFLLRLREGGIRMGRTGTVANASESVEGSETSENAAHASKLLIERKFLVKIPEAGALLSGIFDRVDIVPARVSEGSCVPFVSITDYKSSVGKKDPARMVRDNLQLQLYSLAAQRLFGVVPAELAIESIEDGRRGVIVPAAADTGLALEAISEAASAIRAEKFDATPSFQACMFCAFKNTCPYSSARRASM